MSDELRELIEHIEDIAPALRRQNVLIAKQNQLLGLIAIFVGNKQGSPIPDEILRRADRLANDDILWD